MLMLQFSCRFKIMVLWLRPLGFNVTIQLISPAGNLPIQEHIRRQGRTLHWLLERCGNRYQVMPNQSLAPEAQLTELFAKIQKIVKANNRPKEIQYRMYTQVRQEVSTTMEWRQQGRQEEIEMTLMHDVQDGRPRGRQEMASRWSFMLRGRGTLITYF